MWGGESKKQIWPREKGGFVQRRRRKEASYDPRGLGSCNGPLVLSRLKRAGSFYPTGARNLMRTDANTKMGLALGSSLQGRTIPSEGLTGNLQPPALQQWRECRLSSEGAAGSGKHSIAPSTQATAVVCVTGKAAWPRVLTVKVRRSAVFLNCFQSRVKIMC